MITTEEEDKILDKFEESLKSRKLVFSQRHRLRWWAAKAVIFWVRQNKPEKVQFT